MIELYNTLTRKKEKLTTRVPGKIGIYVCGPTTYNYIHLGNARPLVVFDTVRRYLLYKGYDVTYIQNFTDVDDKIIQRAQQEGADPLALAQGYINEFFADSDALNVLRADHHPRVSENIPEIIALVETLIQRGFAYPVEGDVYFNVRAFEGYGKLSGRSLDDMRAGARIDVNQAKQDPMDFVLWKKSKPAEPSWDSPWGAGRPGWHIECSAMSMKYLQDGVDIHGGGYDLIFPHHENEIAQSEAATDQAFANYWMHNGFITINQEKMSKSLDNFFLVREILSKFSPEVVRFYLLSTHYRSPLDFDDGKLQSTQRGLERIKNSYKLLQESLASATTPGEPASQDEQFTITLEQLQEKFEQAMDDDFNTALASAVWFDLARGINSYLNKLSSQKTRATRQVLEQAVTLYNTFNQVLGVFKLDAATGQLAMGGQSAKDDDLVDQLLALIVEVRQQARANKDWATADTIRDRLQGLGITLEDTPQGVRWRR